MHRVRAMTLQMRLAAPLHCGLPRSSRDAAPSPCVPNTSLLRNAVLLYGTPFCLCILSVEAKDLQIFICPHDSWLCASPGSQIDVLAAFWSIGEERNLGWSEKHQGACLDFLFTNHTVSLQAFLSPLPVFDAKEHTAKDY